MSIDVFPATALNATLWNGQTYEEGTFTVTATGFSGTPPTGTARYVRAGTQVALELPSLNGTSNATTFTVTGLPDRLRPRTTQVYPLEVSSLSYVFGILVLFAEHSVIELYPDGAYGTAWTATGFKACTAITIVYQLTSTLSAPGWTGQSYEEGTFTVTATGFSGTPPSATVRYVRVGKQVTMMFPEINGTSNDTTFTLTGIPAMLQALNYQLLFASIFDSVAGRVAGSILVRPGALAWNVERFGGVFAASGTKALQVCTITYSLL